MQAYTHYFVRPAPGVEPTGGAALALGVEAGAAGASAAAAEVAQDTAEDNPALPDLCSKRVSAGDQVFWSQLASLHGEDALGKISAFEVGASWRAMDELAYNLVLPFKAIDDGAAAAGASAGASTSAAKRPKALPKPKASKVVQPGLVSADWQPLFFPTEVRCRDCTRAAPALGFAWHALRGRRPQKATLMTAMQTLSPELQQQERRVRVHEPRGAPVDAQPTSGSPGAAKGRVPQVRPVTL